MKSIGANASHASRILAKASTTTKNDALTKIAFALEENRANLLIANSQDMNNARTHGLDAAMLDRLALSESRINAMIEGLSQVAALPDPIGHVTDLQSRPSGIELGKMRVPLGVIGIIYESRPNVTIDAASLCLKSGNATILRGGSEAILTNQALASCINQGLLSAGLPSTAVQVIQTTDRDAVGELITMTDHVDIIIPRGGKGLIKRLIADARVPTIKHLDGNCHLFVHEDADLAMAQSLVLNGKTQRYAVCNALDTVLLHRALPQAFLNELMSALQAEGVEIRVCEDTRARLAAPEKVRLAETSDWSSEYLAPILAVKTCDGVDDAIRHINQYGSNHTDVIVTAGLSAAQQFLREVDSSSVMVNASSRFADGFEYGLGAEIGISTDKLHARGPVGLEGLTSEKFVVMGTGQIRQ